ncbi:hypothetical protein, partial [Devosia elaeis]|uniref:hypothetical protein n=1 Tax=Devosia elaeis TaxID=1770058 RepID=UPI000B104A93
IVASVSSRLPRYTVSQIAGPETAIGVLRDYQTLVAGLATVAALFIAAQQLRRQTNRDAIDARRHHQDELDTLVELDRAASVLARSASRRPSPYGAALPYDRHRWERLRQQSHFSVSPSVSTVMRAVETYNGLVSPKEEPSFGLSLNLGRSERGEHPYERTRVYLAAGLLTAAVHERRDAVLRDVEASS